MDARHAKLVARIRKLLALAESQNKHEAENAKLEAERLKRKHGFTDEDVAPERRLHLARAGALDDDSAWRKEVAFGVGKVRNCRALSVRGHLFFEGKDPDTAVLQYQSITGQIDTANAESWTARIRRAQMWDEIQPIWFFYFRMNAAWAVNDRLTNTVAAARVELERRVEMERQEERHQAQQERNRKRREVQPENDDRVAAVDDSNNGVETSGKDVVEPVDRDIVDLAWKLAAKTGFHYVNNDIIRAIREGREAGERVYLGDRKLLE